MRNSVLAACLALAAWCGAALAAERLVTLESRPGVRMSYWWMDRPEATATVVLIPGGKGGIGLKDGVPTSPNYLVRSRDLFAAEGLDVAIVGRASDSSGYELSDRIKPEHLRDLTAIVERARTDAGKPVWIVGTSAGTVSAAALAIAAGEHIDGLVLSSSIEDEVREQHLDAIRVPTLVLHHKRDACRLTPPSGAKAIDAALKNAQAHRLVVIDSGSGARGPYCEPYHWHGFVGAEGEAVRAIADFIRAQQ